jgi:hypothetical protein
MLALGLERGTYSTFTSCETMEALRLKTERATPRRYLVPQAQAAHAPASARYIAAKNKLPRCKSAELFFSCCGSVAALPASVNCNERRVAARSGAATKYLRRKTSSAAGSGLDATIKYLRRAASIGLETTIKYLQRRTSAAAGNGLGTTISYLRQTMSGAAGNGLGNTANFLRHTTSSAARNGLAQGSSTCDAQRAAPRATVRAPRFSTCAAPRASAWAQRSSICAGPRASVWATRINTYDNQ